jgi:phosphoenolpyruvate synthase/pyruvate phosphate dikinase
MSQPKYVYFFGAGSAEGNAEMRSLLGGKGANLAEMTNLGVPVPPGFTISTEVCKLYYENGKQYPDGLDAQIDENLEKLEAAMGVKFGDSEEPLLLSVRSGAAVSMPGMMDTVLNLGLNDDTIQGLIAKSGNERFAYDAYRRFIQMFGNVVLGVEHHEFEHLLAAKKEAKGITLDTDLDANDLKKLVSEFKATVKHTTGNDFPDDPRQQLNMSRDAVFESSGNERATIYRRLNNISEVLGRTAVNVQAMVFGNMGETSGTGVAFTRNPSTGENRFYGEFLMNAQGEDVVAGIRTPLPIDELNDINPDAYNQLVDIGHRLETHYREMQDVEFTIQAGTLFMLQTRSGKRTGPAAVRIAVEMVEEGLIDKATAVTRVPPNDLDQLLHPMIDPDAEVDVIAKGLPASPGAAVGKVVFTADRAEELAATDEKVILVRTETSPEDIGGMHAAEGILTARGGMTCVAGESIILTQKGFLTAKDAFGAIEAGESLSILSFDPHTLQPIWRQIVATGRRVSPVISVAVSQTGRADGNVLRITPDHKMYTFQNRQLIKKRLDACLQDEDFLCVVEQIPTYQESVNTDALAYTAGAIFTDGYVNLRRTKGSVTFTQKDVPKKKAFIAAVQTSFTDAFGESFTYSRSRHTNGVLRGREISGTAQDLISFKREPARILAEIEENVVPWVMSLDENSLFSFLAGAIDGDGTFSDNRIMIYISKEHLLQGIVLACLRLGIVPQVTVNRNIYNVQIVEKIDELLSYTHRVQGETRERRYSSKLFGIRPLFSDLVEEVNYKGRVREALKRNLLFGADKIERDLLPLCSDDEREILEAVLQSSLRMVRVRQIKDEQETEVYNFEVDCEEELGKNFVVFTSRYTPILVSNSHAAVVARGMGKCCVAGCGDLTINEDAKEFRADGRQYHEGDFITLNGSTGEVIHGALDLIEPTLSGHFSTLMEWADEFRTLGVRTNADTPGDSKRAREFGAEGIGLCRTEHMFFDEERIDAMREMILAENEVGRKRALAKLLPFQREDFIGIFEAMDGYPVTIRTLDPPLHEFLPHDDEGINELAGKIGVSSEALHERIEALKEFNPMLGHRGCRLGIAYPEITEMQARAIFEAAVEATKRGIEAIPEIMIPLVGHVNELALQRRLVIKTAEKVFEETGTEVEYLVGTMIELPRAALTADEIATEAEFFSYGTNDLTQTTFGMSRDDAGKFLGDYVDKYGILEHDPFQVLDQGGVGQLVRIGTEKGRQTRADLKVGICGEHGGEPSSVEFCHGVGLNYVSCSPFRVPIARLAAAQAAIKG